MFKYEENEADVTTFPGKKDCTWNCNNSVQLAKILFHCHYRQLNLCIIYLYMYQEFIAVRVCNSHMVSTPAIWIGWRRQSAVNMLSCENTVVKRQAFARVHIANVQWDLEWLHVKYLLSTFAADCLRHPIQMAGTETIYGSCTLFLL